MKKRNSSPQFQKRTVKTKSVQESVTIGMDLGDKTSRDCMLSSAGEILREDQVATTKAGMVETFGRLGRALNRHRSWNPFSLGESLVAEPWT
jgi:hypothetical protein